MKPHLGAVSLLVRDYDEAIAWYTRVLGFALAEDTPLGGGKRWVVIAPPGSTETRLLLAQAMKPEEIAAIGRQGAGRVWLFLHTDNFVRDHRAFTVHHPRRATGDESLRHGPPISANRARRDPQKPRDRRNANIHGNFAGTREQRLTKLAG